MKIFKLFVSSLVLVLVVATGCTSSNKADAQAPRAITPQEVQGLVSNDFAVVVDVREADERSETIPNERWIATSKVTGDETAWNDFVKQLPKDKTIVFHCVAGGRAKRAAEKLSAQGYKTAFFKGVDEWKSAGLPVKKGP